jgi:hypothetical protein
MGGQNLNLQHDPRNSATGLLFSKVTQTVNLNFNTNVSLLGIFNYLGTKKLTTTFTNPLYSGVQFGSFGFTTGIVRVGGSHSASFSGSHDNVERLADKGINISTQVPALASELTFDFCSCTQSFSQTGIMNSLVSISGVMLAGSSANGATNVTISGSNDGVNYTQIVTGLNANVNALAFYQFSASKFYRFIKITGASMWISEVEFYGRIRFIK